MKSWWRNSVIGMLVASMMIAFGTNPGMAESRAHVYLLRGLMNIFSLGMDSLAEELETDEAVFQAEKAFMATLLTRVSEDLVNRMFGWRSQA